MLARLYIAAMKYMDDKAQGCRYELYGRYKAYGLTSRYQLYSLFEWMLVRHRGTRIHIGTK